MTFVDFLFNGAPDSPPSSTEYLEFETPFLSIVVLVAITPSTLYFRSNFAIESNSLLELSGETLTTKGTNFLNFL